MPTHGRKGLTRLRHWTLVSSLNRLRLRTCSGHFLNNARFHKTSARSIYGAVDAHLDLAILLSRPRSPFLCAPIASTELADTNAGESWNLVPSAVHNGSLSSSHSYQPKQINLSSRELNHCDTVLTTIPIRAFINLRLSFFVGSLL